MDQNQTMRTCDTLLLSAADGQQALQKAGQLIRQGGLVAFPTETVYGLGADGLNPAAVKRIYAAKGRPSDNPLILHISNLEMLKPIVQEISPMAKALMEKFWRMRPRRRCMPKIFRRSTTGCANSFLRDR